MGRTKAFTCALAIALGVSVATSAPSWGGSIEYPGPTPDAAGPIEVSWPVPTGVEVVQVRLQGAGGGDGFAVGATARGGNGGLGANIEISIDVADLEIEVLEIGLGTRGGDGGENADNAGGASPFGLWSGGRGGQLGAAGAAHYGGGGGGLSALRGQRDGAWGYVLFAPGGGGGGSAVETNFAGNPQNPSGGSGGNGTSLGGPIIRTGDGGVSGNAGTPGSDPVGGRGGGGGSTPVGTGGTFTVGAGGDNGGQPGDFDGGGAGGTNHCSGGGGGAGLAGGGGGGANTDLVNQGCGGGGAGVSGFGTMYRATSVGATSTMSLGQINWISFVTTGLATGRVGHHYHQPIEAEFSSGITPNLWSVTPALPTGLTLDTSTGLITGTPTEESTGQYTVSASYERFDLGGLIARSSATFDLAIASPAPPPAPIVFPPSAPLDAVAQAGDSTVTVTWQPPLSPGSFPVSTYQVTGTPAGSCLVAAPATTCDIEGLTNGVPHTFEVRALNGAGWGAWSTPTPSVTPETQAIIILGSRPGTRQKPHIVVEGIASGFTPGQILHPSFRMAGKDSFTRGSAQISPDEEGTFRWQRRARKTITVFIATEDFTVISNEVTIRRS